MATANNTSIPAPLNIIIFGASGDLTRRKLIPAIYTLHVEKRLPKHYQVVGVARSPYSDEDFRTHLRGGVAENARLQGDDDDAWARFAEHVSYLPGVYDDPDTYRRLGELLGELDGRAGAANHLFYLATPPELYPLIVTQLGAAGLHESEDGYVRIIIEKPFGHDLQSAQALNATVHDVFDESQIYRIDHYLGKETVQNMMVFRFANAIFEPLWNRGYVDHVQITVAETVGVGNRVGFYEQAGVLRDVFQNHLLQLLALTAMEPPAAFNARFLRDEKVKVLQAVHPMTPEEIITNTVRGQYRTYRDEPGVAPGSNTATFAALHLEIDNWRWQGVPFYLRSGKALAAKVSEITIQWKGVPHRLLPTVTREAPHANYLTLRIQPDEGMHLRFEAKTPGLGMRARSVVMDFNFGAEFGKEALPDAYERLLLDAMGGDASLFLRSDEIELSWQVIDPIVAAWEKSREPLLGFYEKSTWGTPEADQMLTCAGRHWRTEGEPRSVTRARCR